MAKKKALLLALMLQVAFFMGVPASAEAINTIDEQGCKQVYKTLFNLKKASENDKRALERETLEMEQLILERDAVLQSFEGQSGNTLIKFLNKIRKFPYVIKYKILCYLLETSINTLGKDVEDARDFQEKLNEIFEKVCPEYIHIRH